MNDDVIIAASLAFPAELKKVTLNELYTRTLRQPLFYKTKCKYNTFYAQLRCDLDFI